MSNPLQNTKWVQCVHPAALVDNASLTFDELDTKGYDYCTIALLVGATDIAATACKLTESDTSGSGHADITPSIYGTATDIDGSTSALPTATDDEGIFLWEIDLRGRKRYIDATITIGDGTAGGYYTAFAILSRGENTKLTKTGRNLSGCLQF
jgi:hypothetical protein